MYVVNASEVNKTTSIVDFSKVYSGGTDGKTKTASANTDGVLTETSEGVTVEFSQEAIDMMEAKKQELEEKAAEREEELRAKKEAEAQLEMMERQMEEMKKNAEAAGEAFAELGKIMEVARRIMRGDHVPPQDEKKLMEFDNDLYQACKTAGMLSKIRDKKKHDSLWEEEDSVDKMARALEREDEADASASPAAAPPSEEAAAPEIVETSEAVEVSE